MINIESIQNISLMSHDIDQYWPGIKNGDEKTFEKMFKETYPSLCYYTKQITRDSHLAEEIVQDIFQKIWQRRDSIIIASSFKSYLFQSLRNLALDSVKKKSSRRLSFSNTVSEESWQFILETFKSDDYIIEKIITGETEKSIRTVINSLPPQCCKVFLKSYEDNMSINDIALQLKISPNTVRVHIHNALIKINEFLQKEE